MNLESFMKAEETHTQVLKEISLWQLEVVKHSKAEAVVALDKSPNALS